MSDGLSHFAPVFNMRRLMMFYKSPWPAVSLAIFTAVCLIWGTDAGACDKSKARPVPVPVPVVEVPCPPVPCCCQDARICVSAELSRVCYTEAGVRAFITLFQEAAVKGVENATIRAFNATKVVPDCVPSGAPKKK
jgi:hypothetical protein